MDLIGRTVAVTGVTGLLGAYVARALMEAGARVRGLARCQKRADLLRMPPPQWEVACVDLRDREGMIEALAGCDAVVGCAALYKMQLLPWSQFYETNVRGTENLFAALRGNGIRRLVHISSWGVYRFRAGRLMDEDTPRIVGAQGEGGGYRATKEIAERRAEELGRRWGIGVTVLRPSGIYGAGDTQLLPRMRRLLRVPWLPAPAATFPFVYAGDCARAVVGALQNDASAGHSYNTGGPNLPLPCFLRALAQVVPDARARFLSVPLPLHFSLDNRRACMDLGFSNRDYAQGLEETLKLESAVS